MKNKNIVIILAALFVSVCILPIVVLAVALIISTLPPGGLQDVGSALVFALVCLGPVALVFGGFGWKIYHNVKSSKAAVRLGESLGLEKLNQARSPVNVWYGGVFDGRRFAVKPVGIKSHFYDGGGRRRPDASYYLRIVLEVKVDEPLDVVVYRRPQERGGATTFEETFPTVKNASRLTGSAQAALLAFAQMGYETGLQGTTYRYDKGARNLTLRDRAGMPEAQLARDVLPDAPVILVHDHPKPNLPAEALNELLGEMTAVVQAVEFSFR
jgi:hypothetical protein